MSEFLGDKEAGAQSKFEWRPEDVTILTPEEAAAAEAEYQELLVEMDREAAEGENG
jgi:hypothetical protein